MKIKLKNRGDRKGWYIRPIKRKDFSDFADTMADWPRDHIGSFTINRSMAVLEKHVRHSENLSYPLKAEDEFNMVWVLCNPNNEFAGYFRNKVRPGKICHLGQLAIHPDFRGQGLTRLIIYFQSYVCWYLYEAEEWTFEIMDENPRLIKKVNQHEVQSTGEREGSTGAKVKAFRYTKAEHQGVYTRPTYSKDAQDGVTIAEGEVGYSHIFEIIS